MPDTLESLRARIAELEAEDARKASVIEFLQRAAQASKDRKGQLERHLSRAKEQLEGSEAQARIAEFEDALKPFATFMDQFDRRPLRSIDDRLYSIHMGTEFEAELRMSHLRRARAVLNKEKRTG